MLPPSLALRFLEDAKSAVPVLHPKKREIWK
jgi:hypothetical protein